MERLPPPPPHSVQGNPPIHRTQHVQQARLIQRPTDAASQQAHQFQPQARRSLPLTHCHQQLQQQRNLMAPFRKQKLTSIVAVPSNNRESANALTTHPNPLTESRNPSQNAIAAPANSAPQPHPPRLQLSKRAAYSWTGCQLSSTPTNWSAANA